MLEKAALPLQVTSGTDGGFRVLTQPMEAPGGARSARRVADVCGPASGLGPAEALAFACAIARLPTFVPALRGLLEAADDLSTSLPVADLSPDNRKKLEAFATARRAARAELAALLAMQEAEPGG